jgi:hypothetical protein
VQALTHESFFKGENVFELGKKLPHLINSLGSQGDKFYIILEGEVGVMIPRTSN